MLREIAFVDRNVHDLATLLVGLRPELDPILLSDDEPALCQIARRVRRGAGLDAIHVIAHGRVGEVSFGAGALSLESLAGHAADLRAIGQALGNDGKLLLWSCQTAAGARGSIFVEALKSATGAEVRAATGTIGSQLLGGRWELDVSSGKETVSAPLTTQGIADYAGVLAITKASLTAITTDSGTPNDFITNDNTLIFSGTETGISVLGIWISGGIYGTGNGGKGTLIGTVPTDPLSNNSRWSFSYGTTLADGSYTVRLTNGSASGASALSTRTIGIDTTPPTVSSVVASGAGITNGNGDLNAGKVVTLTVAFSNAVTVNTSGGTPTLALNDGGAATYTGGSGSNSLIFSYTVAAGQTTSDLTVTAFNLNGATVRDAAGNDVNLAGAVTNPSGTLIIDTSPPGSPTILQVTDDVLPVTGVVANGGSTDDTTPTVRIGLSGTNAAAGDQAQLFNGTSALGSAIVLTSGNISNGFVDVTTAALAQGTYNFDARITDVAGNTSGASTNYSVTIGTTPPTVSSVAASGAGITNGNGDLNAGKVVTLTVAFSNAVTVNTSGGTPTLALNDGGAATYTGGSGSNSLIFSYTVAAGQTTSDLTVTAFNLNGATVRDAAGNVANLAGAVTNPSGTLIIDTSPPGSPTILQVTDDVLPVTGVVANGGSTDDTTPTVRIGLSGTNAAAGDQAQLFNGTSALGSAIVLTSGNISSGFVDVTTAALAQGTYNFNAIITDVAGNTSGASTNYSVTIGTTPPTVSSVAASGAGITNGNGDLNAGKVVTLTVAFSNAVTVNTSGGTPTLALNDGGAATYTGGSGSNSLIFSYTVAAGQTTSDLTVTAFNLNGATVRDAAGNVANLAGAVTNPSGTLIIDTSPPGSPTILQVTDDVLPVTGVVANGGSTDDTTPTVRIGLSGTNAAAGDQAQLFNGTSALGSAIVLTSGNISNGFVDVTTAALAQGTYNFDARITDIAGNTGGASTNYSVTINSGAAPSKIVTENLNTGTPQSVWAIHGSIANQGDSQIEGFATQISTNAGQTVSFKIDTASSGYTLDIYRLGYYGGNGARLITTMHHSGADNQPNPIFNSATNTVDAGNWSVTDSWTIPSTAVSGVYFAKLTTDAGNFQNMIPFIVRNDGTASDILFQTSDTTWQAYNPWGGYNLYFGPDLKHSDRAYAVSYNRPIDMNVNLNGTGSQDFLFGEEYAAIYWLEQNGYNVSYISGIDAATNAGLLLNTKAYIDVGHDEYWSQSQFANVKAARDAGIDLAFLSGNQIYWDTELAPSFDSSQTPNRTIVEYKDIWSGTQLDPNGTSNGGAGLFRDPLYGPGTPENSLSGTIFTVDGAPVGAEHLDNISIPATMSQLRFWRNTSIASGNGGTLTNLLGFEWDSDLDNGFRPAGLIDLSLTTLNVNTLLLDNGLTDGPGTATHSLTLYRDTTSGALVFGAGTIMWSWGLSNQYAPYYGITAPVSAAVQQSMVNLFADMGVQPETLQASLVLAQASSDHTSPTAVITSPSGGTNVIQGQTVTITGAASDVGGSVAGIEVSTDGGATWHPAAGTTNWSYTWTAASPGTAVIEARATDDSVNLQSSPATVSVNVTGGTPPSLFTASATPVETSPNEGQQVEVGVKFQSSVAGQITALKFYRSPSDTGSDLLDLWSSTGISLASVPFTNTAASGWQTVNLATPVTISANTTYVVSYHTSGFFVKTANFFTTTAFTNGVLTAPSSTTAGGNGVFADAGTSTAAIFPTNTYLDANYWADVVFQPTSGTPPTVSSVAASGAGITNGNGDLNAGKVVTLTVAFSNAVTVNTSGGTPTLALNDGGAATYTGGSGSNSLIFSYTVAAGQTTSDLTVTAFNLNGATVRDAAGNVANLAGAVTNPSGTLIIDTSPPGSPTILQVTDDVLPVTGVVANGGSTDDTTPTVRIGLSGTNAAAGDQAQLFNGTSALGSAIVLTSGNISNGFVDVTTAALAQGTYNFDARITDVAGNTSGASTNYSVTINSGAAASSLFTASATPVEISPTEGQQVEVGVKFQSSVAGQITALKFYRSPSDTGSDLLDLWSSTGISLASVPFTNTAASGWQTMNLATPVTISANTTYVVSYHTSGFFVKTANFFTTTAFTNGVLTAPSSTTAGGNGVFADAGTSTAAIFPTNTYLDANYWADVVFQPTSGLSVTVSGMAQVGQTLTATPSGAVTGYQWQSFIGGTWTNVSSATSSTYVVQGADEGHQLRVHVASSGGSADSAATSAVTPPSLFTASATPVETSPTEGQQVEVGVKFQSSVAGQITALKFYRSPSDTGSDLLDLWSSTGISLASVPFTNTAASGWQTVNLATPVTISANTTYVVSYHTSGFFVKTANFFTTTAFTNGVLTAPSSTTAGGNGVFADAGTSTAAIFPTNTYLDANYWADVVFQPTSGNSLAPAGVAGQPIALGLADPSVDPADAITMRVTGTASDWSLNAGMQNSDGSWTVHTNDPGSLAVTPSADFVGAAVIYVNETWTNPDGSTGNAVVSDNVEAYSAGSPIFAVSGDDHLTGAGANDMFVFAQPIGNDVIYNFNAASDKIDLIGFNNVASFSNIQANLTDDVNGNAVIALGVGRTITLHGVDASSLNANNFVFDQQPVTNNPGNMVVSDGATLPLSGIVNNSGTIVLNSTSNKTDLELIQYGVTLQGGGALRLSDSVANAIFGTDPSVTLTNVDNTISGAGQLGEGQLTLHNMGTILASGGNALTIDTGANEVVNSGTLRATGSGGLVINSDIANSGLLWANGGNITTDGNVSGTGSVLIDGVATFEMGGAFSENFTLDAGANATLKIDHAADFRGTVTGFDSNDLFDLADLAFGSKTTLGYAANSNNTGGTLTVSDGTNFANIALLGQYAAASFVMSGDGSGGTLIHELPPVTLAQTLTQPHQA